MKSPQRRSTLLVLCLTLLMPGASILGQQKKRDAQSSQSEAIVTADEAAQLEAVIATDLGVIRFEFFANKALKHSLAPASTTARRFTESSRAASFKAETRSSKILKRLASVGARAP